jgi:hypothetical protein
LKTWQKITVLLFLVLGANVAWSQTQPKLALIFSDIYGPQGLKVDSTAPVDPGSTLTHTPHFNSSFQQSFSAFNTALASRLTAVPLPSPASGFTYQFNKESGALTRSTQSFGPILADRAETIGRNKVSVSFNYQYFKFNSIEGINLDSVPAVFTHDADPATGLRTAGRTDIVSTKNAIKVSVDQFTAFVNYGVANHVDVSVAIPIVRTSLALTSDATIYRLGTTNDNVHFFYATPGDTTSAIGKSRHFPIAGTLSSGTASGIGDVIFRVKANVLRREATAVAVGMDFRAPSGDAQNLLGSGAPGVKPFIALTFSHNRIAPHLNLGYQWNGNSILAGNDVAAGTKAKLPGEFLYTAGFDFGATRRLTLAFDVLGEAVHGPRLVESNQSYACAGGSDCPTAASQSFSNINFPNETYSIVNGAAGFKFSPSQHFLIGVNALFKMNNAGLRSNVTPLVGAEYSF